MFDFNSIKSVQIFSFMFDGIIANNREINLSLEMFKLQVRFLCNEAPVFGFDDILFLDLVKCILYDVVKFTSVAHQMLLNFTGLNLSSRIIKILIPMSDEKKKERGCEKRFLDRKFCRLLISCIHNIFYALIN